MPERLLQKIIRNILLKSTSQNLKLIVKMMKNIKESKEYENIYLKFEKLGDNIYIFLVWNCFISSIFCGEKN